MPVREPMVATVALPLLHVPPDDAGSVRVLVAPRHTVAGGMTGGDVLTVTVLRVRQPVDNL